jgi:hypothetical protein
MITCKKPSYNESYSLQYFRVASYIRTESPGGELRFSGDGDELRAVGLLTLYNKLDSASRRHRNSLVTYSTHDLSLLIHFLLSMATKTSNKRPRQGDRRDRDGERDEEDPRTMTEADVLAIHSEFAVELVRQAVEDFNNNSEDAGKQVDRKHGHCASDAGRNDEDNSNDDEDDGDGSLRSGHSSNDHNHNHSWDVQSIASLVWLVMKQLCIHTAPEKHIYKFLKRCKVYNTLILSELMERGNALQSMKGKRIIKLICAESGENPLFMFDRLGEAFELGVIRVDDDKVMAKVAEIFADIPLNHQLKAAIQLCGHCEHKRECGRILAHLTSTKPTTNAAAAFICDVISQEFYLDLRGKQTEFISSVNAFYLDLGEEVDELIGK